ncbi:hypothetical protein ACPV5G_05430 [Photobacterium damselae]|uniref:hypothetical protein n=1 Tax=Photobacterium damselae TaxID=38293 RepID=UPI001485986F|nr:hypothetical protein [Photobacterium damselae]
MGAAIDSCILGMDKISAILVILLITKCKIIKQKLTNIKDKAKVKVGLLLSLAVLAFVD